MARARQILMLGGLVSLVLGLGSAVLCIQIASRRGAIRVGPWATSMTFGASDAGIYERAAAAIHALFVLNRAETFYYRAHTDDDGRDLDAGCDYEIRGRPLEARWWSITAYGADDFLIPNSEGRYSFNMANFTKEADGSFVIRASSGKKPGDWLPLGGRGHVSFVLRLYVPSPELAAGPERAALPSIAGRCP